MPYQPHYTLLGQYSWQQGPSLRYSLYPSFRLNAGCQVPIFSYFFLFFGLPPIFSYFFMKFLVFPIFFRVLLGTQKHFEIFEIILPIKLINVTKNWNFISTKTSLKPLWVIFFWNSCPDFFSAFDSIQGMSIYSLLTTNLSLEIKLERPWHVWILLSRGSPFLALEHFMVPQYPTFSTLRK